MIVVYTLESGDVAYRCSICDKTEIVSIVFVESPFWDVYNGRAVLMALGHYESHNDSNTP